MLFAPAEMLSGKQFKILRATLAVESVNGKRTAVVVPNGAIVRVISGPTVADPLVNLHWGSRRVEMFAIDVQNRGAEVTSANGD